MGWSRAFNYQLFCIPLTSIKRTELMKGKSYGLFLEDIPMLILQLYMIYIGIGSKGEQMLFLIGLATSLISIFTSMMNSFFSTDVTSLQVKSLWVRVYHPKKKLK